MTLTQGIITREEALKLCPNYVKFVEGDFDAFSAMFENFERAKRGKEAITAHGDLPLRPVSEAPKAVFQSLPRIVFVRVKISSVNANDPRAVDGPVVRVTNGEYSWRVDGCHYAFVL
jgi:hypothetical protein